MRPNHWKDNFITSNKYFAQNPNTLDSSSELNLSSWISLLIYLMEGSAHHSKDLEVERKETAHLKLPGDQADIQCPCTDVHQRTYSDVEQFPKCRHTSCLGDRSQESWVKQMTPVLVGIHMSPSLQEVLVPVFYSYWVFGAPINYFHCKCCYYP